MADQQGPRANRGERSAAQEWSPFRRVRIEAFHFDSSKRAGKASEALSRLSRRRMLDAVGEVGYFGHRADACKETNAIFVSR